MYIIRILGRNEEETCVQEYNSCFNLFNLKVCMLNWIHRGRAHVGGRFGQRSRLVAAHFALY
jgi:hypothetical protein